MARSGTEFRRLYESHAPHVRRFVAFLGADAALADDIVSETFVRAWTAAEPIRQETARAYLFTIARNLFRDANRRARRDARLEDHIPDEGVTAQQRVENRSELSSVLREMRRLPEVDRAALLMRALEQLSYEEISRALGLSPSAVKVKVHRARLKLMRATRGATRMRSETP